MSRRTSFPPPASNLRDELLLRTAEAILRNGHMVISVGNGRCLDPTCTCEASANPWAYSIGFAAHDHPEIVTFGLQDRCISYLIGWLFEELRDGMPLDIGEVANLDGHLIKLASVPDEWLTHDFERMSVWFQHYAPGRTQLTLPHVAQMMWADGAGVFPDEEGCDPHVVARQPVLALDPYSSPPAGNRQQRRQRRRRAR